MSHSLHIQEGDQNQTVFHLYLQKAVQHESLGSLLSVYGPKKYKVRHLYGLGQSVTSPV
jgi:hypothetical protein